LLHYNEQRQVTGQALSVSVVNSVAVGFDGAYTSLAERGLMIGCTALSSLAAPAMRDLSRRVTKPERGQERDVAP
jgi:hypothetical protein